MVINFKINNSPVSILLIGGLFLFLNFSVNAQQIYVKPGKGTLQAAINTANMGDTLRLQEGAYTGSVIINRTISIIGSKKSIVDGEKTGHVITVAAPDVLIKGLTIHYSGNDLETEDSAIFVTKEGDRSTIEDNYFEHNLMGVYLKGPESVAVNNNVIIGSRYHRVNDRGNGVYLWNTPGSVVKNNDIRYGRDGIYVTTSRDNLFEGNRIRNLRFAVHYMYTNNSVVSNNVSSDNNVGYALMFSDRIIARNNKSVRDEMRGLFFNFANYSVIENNSVSGGTEKCVFIYNANYNSVNNNSFADCQVGIHFTAGSEKNDFYANSFINNRTQVKYVGTRFIEWSKNGVGNYWSDNVAFDIDNNGIADQPYKPNDIVDQIVWRHPMAKLLLNSPSVQILKWAQSEFPGLHPGGVTDSAPLMLAPGINDIVKKKQYREDSPNG